MVVVYGRERDGDVEAMRISSARLIIVGGRRFGLALDPGRVAGSKVERE